MLALRVGVLPSITAKPQLTLEKAEPIHSPYFLRAFIIVTGKSQIRPNCTMARGVITILYDSNHKSDPDQDPYFL